MVMMSAFQPSLLFKMIFSLRVVNNLFKQVVQIEKLIVSIT